MGALTSPKQLSARLTKLDSSLQWVLDCVGEGTTPTAVLARLWTGTQILKLFQQKAELSGEKRSRE